MPAKKKNIRKPSKTKRRGKISLDASNVVIVKHTVAKQTLFPEKLKKLNEMLKNAEWME